ncbi:MAG: hypothetical protein LBJ64_12690, partial [Deltaproteobacteria bacterium]|nr:hypothetical protein [Deltaproteobacteria bacterium]
MQRYYRPSGNFSPGAIIVVPAVVAAISLLLAVPYGYLSWYNPVKFLGVALTVIFAVAVCLAGGFLSFKLAPVRNPPLAALLGVIGVIPGLLLHALIWMDLFRNRTGEIGSLGPENLRLIWQNSHLVPADLLDYFLNYKLASRFLLDIINYGVWDIFGLPLKGLPYEMIWILEFLLVIVAVAWHFYKKACWPFCEDQGIFLEKISFPQFLRTPPDMDRLLDSFAQGEYGYVMIADIEPDPKYNHLKIELYYLEERHDAYLTVWLVKKSIKKTETTKVVDAIGIPEIQAEQLIKKL